MTLPQFYPDNVAFTTADTTIIRGNNVSDIHGPAAVGIKVTGADYLRVKENKVVRVRSAVANAKCYEIDNTNDAVFIYNIASRSNVGFDFQTITTLNVYNATVHLCNRCINVEASGTFRNIALSAYPGYDLYRKSYGFYAPTGTIDVDYVYHYGLAGLVESAFVDVLGGNITEDQVLYMDEANDDLTPDYISRVIDQGTPNSFSSEFIDISGIESEVTTEATAKPNYWYDLIDNSFWDVENPQAAEVTFIKSIQSRVLASSEVETTHVKADVYVKFANDMERFSEVYPMHMRYMNATRFKKSVMDMWFSGQNVGVLQAYQNAIGGSQRFPTFFRRMSDYPDGWILDVSYVDYDNWLNSQLDLKYGIGLDVLGLSTLNQGASGECYNNVQNTVADIAPVRWFTHAQVQPYGYTMFADLGWGGFEQCTLENMHYNDDFGISVLDISVSGSIVTPLISTTTATASGYTELSLLDRTYSEDIDRHIYYRQGNTLGTMSAWTELNYVICPYIAITKSYIQFKITVDSVPRETDYEFVSLCLRKYYSDLDWTRPTTV